nr:hypothetical protein [Tanacetum cinerariifolium]
GRLPPSQSAAAASGPPPTLAARSANDAPNGAVMLVRAAGRGRLRRGLGLRNSREKSGY